jgi:hypothetical protein
MALLWAGGGLSQDVLVLDLLRLGRGEAADADSHDGEPEQGQ